MNFVSEIRCAGCITAHQFVMPVLSPFLESAFITANLRWSGKIPVHGK